VAANFSPKKFVLVGAGGRAALFLEAISVSHPQDSKILALCDSSAVRMGYYNRQLAEVWHLPPVPTYPAETFGQMLEEQKPDGVIVTSVDCTHADYIVAALEHGCEAITEKPMTIDAARCRAILEARKRTGGKVRVCFNYRWQAAPTKIKELISTGVIGNVRSVMMEYALDTNHGADYFRRWHSEKESSGGLLVHKSTHHFDLVNWWIDSIPAEVFAWGKLAFYGRENAVARGDGKFTGYPRYTGMDSAHDPFAFCLESEEMRGLYLDAEAESGYIRDRNVFRDGINIEDTMSVLVKYRSGVVLTYSLNAFSPTEGYRVIFHGDKGRIEYSNFGESLLNLALSTDAAENLELKVVESLRLFPHFGAAQDIEIPYQKGSHGGGDRILLEQIFSSNPPSEKWGRNAGCEQGAASIIVGIAGNESMKTGLPVRVDELITLQPKATRLEELVH